MKWRWLALVLRASGFVHREPERSALRELAGELAEIDRPRRRDDPG